SRKIFPPPSPEFFFSDTFTLGSKSAGEGFSGPVTMPSHSRWINLNRNYNTTGEIIIAGGISCVWQTTFNKAQLEFFNSNPAADSFQAQLQQALQNDDAQGLMLRWLTYDTIYFQGSVFEDLPAGNTNLRMERVSKLFQQYAAEMEAYRSGKTNKKPATPLNRAYSKALGWLGLWNKGELSTAPGGRQLFAGTTQVQAAKLPESFYVKDSSGAAPAQFFIAPTAVEVAYDGDTVERITVDMGSTMPEQQYDGEKADFGQVQLTLINGSDTTGLPIANLPNDRSTYLRTSGLVDIPASKFLNPITKQDIQFTPFGLTVQSYTSPNSAGTTTLALKESPYTANTDHRGVYANEPRPSWDRDAPDPRFTVQVRYFGALPPKGTKLAFAQYAPDPLMVSSGNWSIVKKNSETQQDPFVKLYQPLPDERDPVIGQSTMLDVPTNGEVTIAAQALRPGFGNIAFYPQGPEATSFKPPAFVPAPFISQAFYTVVRALPFDNLAAVDFANWLKSKPDTQHLPDVALVNQRVFDEVFGLFYRLYPVMDFISNPTKFQEWRGRILAVTDPGILNSATYMPVTRNLSAGKRQMLELWTRYLDGHNLQGAQNKATKKQKQIR
ncbi:MAG: hypothetical protein AAF570_11540, partial [Bacteroidota bacterium]